MFVVHCWKGLWHNMGKFNYEDTDTLKSNTNVSLSKETKLEINKAIARLCSVCHKYKDCVDGCPFAEYTEKGIPHCKLDTTPENWELIK